MIAAGVWVRILVVLVASGTSQGQFVGELLIYVPLQALVTAVCGVLVLLAFREWFAIRLDV